MGFHLAFSFPITPAIMLWFTISTTKPKKVKIVQKELKPLSCQDNLHPALFSFSKKLRPLSIQATTPTRDRPLPPIPACASLIRPHRRSKSLGPGLSSTSSSDANIVCISPPSHKRRRSLSGPFQSEHRVPYDLPLQDGHVDYVQIRPASSSNRNPPRQIEYVQVRSPSSHSRSRARQLEIVQKRSDSTSRIRSRSRGRPIVRDRIIEVVEPPESVRSPPPVPRIEYNPDANPFDPFFAQAEDYDGHRPKTQTYQQLILDWPLHRRAASTVRSPSISTRGKSVSVASSSLRSTKSTSRQSIYSLEQTRSMSRGASMRPSVPTADISTASLGAPTTGTTSSSPPPRRSSSTCTSAGVSPRLRARATSTTRKYCYTPASDGKDGLRAYNRVKILKNVKDVTSSESEKQETDEKLEAAIDEDRRLRRILNIGELASSGRRDKSSSRWRTASVARATEHGS